MAVTDTFVKQDADDKKALHNIVVLTLAQALNYSLAPLSMAIGGLAGNYLLGADKSLATLPVSCFLLGPLFAAYPAAMLMKKAGRRLGFMFGSFLGFLGCALATYAILINQFWLFSFSLLFIGSSIAFAQQYRFAAADFGSNTIKTRGLSWVMAGGVVAAILGPQMAIYFMEFFSPIVFAGSFMGGMILSGLGFFSLLFLKSAPLKEENKETVLKPARPLLTIIKQPLFLTSLICSATSYMTMSLVMTAAPLAMILCGFTSEQSTTAIQFHIIAMFAPSFFTGSLILKYGHMKIIGFSLFLFLVCSIIGLSGIELSQFWAALIALGIAWNFGYVASTSLVTKTYEPQEKSKVQGVFDSLVFGLAGVTSLLSGILLSTVGWNVILVIVLPLLSLCALTLFLQRGEFSKYAL